MKYFSPSYWLKMWLLSAPLFNDETQGINAKSIHNKSNIKDWASKNNTGISVAEHQEINYTNSTEFINYQTQLDIQSWKNNLNPISTNKHRHENSRNRHKRQHTKNQEISTTTTDFFNSTNSTEFKTIETSTESKNTTLFNLKWNSNILQLINKLIIDMSNSEEYISSMNRFLEELIENDILRVFLNPYSVPGPGDQRIFTLNIRDYGYFRLPVEVRGIDQETQQSFTRNLELVIRTDNLYLEGFVSYYTGGHGQNINNYYYFNPNLQTPFYQSYYNSGKIPPRLTQLSGVTSNIMLEKIGADYQYLMTDESEEFFNWFNIYSSFLQLTSDFDAHMEPSLGFLATALGKIIFVTLESLRFKKIYSHIYNDLIFNRGFISMQRKAQTDKFYQILVKWKKSSTKTASYVSNFLNDQQCLKDFEEIVDDLPSTSREDRQDRLIRFFENMAIEELTYLLFQNEVRVILGGFFINKYFCKEQNEKIQKKSTNITIEDSNAMINLTNIDNSYWNEQICDLKPQINKIKGEINKIKIGHQEINEYYWSAKNICLFNNDNEIYIIDKITNVKKFDGINFPIKDIQSDKDNNIYAISDECEIYHLNLGNFRAEKIENAESCDLSKELITYYNNKRESVLFAIEYNNRNKIYHLNEINLNQINPVSNYKKIYFLGNTAPVTASWGNDFYMGIGINDYLFNKEIQNLIVNQKLTDNWNDYDKICSMPLQKLDDTSFIAGVTLQQWFGLTFYWQNGNYYLQTPAIQYGETWSSFSGGALSMWIGNAIKLYNDDTQTNIDYNITINNTTELSNQETTTEIINSTSWSDDFIKSVNHEQHLPVITNNTNYVKNNVTLGV